MSDEISTRLFLMLLLDQGPLSCREIVQESRLEETIAMQYLRRLVFTGYADRRKDKKFVLSRKGDVFVNKYNQKLNRRSNG